MQGTRRRSPSSGSPQENDNGEKQPNDALRVAQVQVGLLGNELAMRALPRVAEVTDAVNHLSRRAEQGDAAAKETLRLLYKALDRGREATSKIDIVRA